MLARPVLLISLSVAILAVPCSGAAEILRENFDNFDVKSLPPNWTLQVSGDFSTVDEAGRGKVLKINHKGNGWPSLTAVLDVAKVQGHTIRIAAAAKCPGNYTAVPDKPWARPRLKLVVKGSDGKEREFRAEVEPNKPDWQSVSATASVDKDAQAIRASLGIDLVAAEVFFDDFVVEVDPDAKVAQPNPNPQPAVVNPTKTSSGTGAQAPPPGGDSAAAKAPKRNLDEGGALFGPEIAAAMMKAAKPGQAPEFKLVVVGPGMPMREFEGKVPDKWVRLPAKDVPGTTAAPRALLVTLPDVLAKSKPEVVFVVGETAPTRKTTMLECLDWEDLARVCLRMGVVPVFAVPPAAPAKDGPIGMAEDLRASMIKAASEVNCPAIDLKTTAQVPRLVTQMLGLLDRHVFCRVPVDQPTGGTGKKVEEE